MFTSRDPLGYVDSYDVWMYVGGNPFAFVDPWGMGGIEAAASSSSHQTVAAIEQGIVASLSLIEELDPSGLSSMALIANAQVLEILAEVLEMSYGTVPASEIGVVIYLNDSGEIFTAAIPPFGDGTSDFVFGTPGAADSAFPIPQTYNSVIAILILHTHPHQSANAHVPSGEGGDISAEHANNFGGTPTAIVWSATGDASSPTIGGVTLYGTVVPGRPQEYGFWFATPGGGPPNGVDLREVASGADRDSASPAQRAAYGGWLRELTRDFAR